MPDLCICSLISTHRRPLKSKEYEYINLLFCGNIADIYGILNFNYLLHIRIVCTQLQIRRRHWSSFQMCPRRNPKSFHSRHLVCTNLQQHTSCNCLHRNQQIDHYILKRSPKNETIGCFVEKISLIFNHFKTVKSGFS